MKGLSRNGSKTSKRSEMRKKLMCKETVLIGEAMSWSKTEPIYNEDLNTVHLNAGNIGIQWGLEYWTLENQIHLRTERFKVWFSNGWVFEWTIRKLNFQNGRSKLGHFIYK